MLSIGEMLFLYRARLRERAVVVQELFAVLGIAVGVALLFASQVASTSLDGSVRELTKQAFAGTQYQLDARGSEGMSDQVIGYVQRLPGVAAALPLIDRQATLIGPRGRIAVDLIGADPRFAHTAGPLLRRFSARQLANQHALALPAPIAASIDAGPLQTIEVQVGARTIESLVGATLQEADVGSLIHSRVALAPIRYAQALIGLDGRVTRIYVKTKPGDEHKVRMGLQGLAGILNLDLAPAEFDATMFKLASAPAEQGEGLFSTISAVVGFVFAFNAMLLTVPERRRTIEGMRRVGATRSMTVQALVFDALIIGLLACVVGLLFGDWLSLDVFHVQPGYLAFAFPVGTPRIVTWSTVALAVGAGMLAALVGVLVPVREIVGRPLRHSASRERVPRGWNVTRLTVGAACLLTTTLILTLRPQSAVVGNLTLILALVALLPFMFVGVVAAFESVQRPFGAASPALALGELKDPLVRVRALAVTATGAIALFGSVAVAGAQHNLQEGLDRAASEWNRSAALWVSPAGEENTLGTTAFSAASASKLRGLSGVRGVSVYRGGFLDVGKRRVWVIAPPRASSQPMPAGQLTSGDAATVDRRLRGHGWAVVSEAIARELHLRVGVSFALPTPRPTSFRVAGLSTNGGWPPGAIVMNAEDYAAAWGSRAASALELSLAPGASASAVRDRAIEALGPNSGLAVQTSGEREAQWKSVSRQGLARLSEIARLVLIAAILAMAGVMASMIWQRREQIAYVKRQGFTRGLLWRALFFESAVLLAAGCSIGAAFGFYGQLLISHALASVTGFPIAIGVDVIVGISSLAIVSVAALSILAIPGYFAVRVRPSLVKPV